MTEEVMREIQQMIEALPERPRKSALAALCVFAEALQETSETHVLLVVLNDVSDGAKLSIYALNTTRDEAYEMLDTACKSTAAEIQAEAPPYDRYN